MLKSLELKEKRNTLVAKIRTTLDKADNEARSMTPTEREEVRKLEAQLGDLDADILTYEKQESREGYLSERTGNAFELSGQSHNVAQPEVWRNTDTGSEVRVLSREHSLEKITRANGGRNIPDGVGFGQMCRALVLGPRNDAERRALSEGVDPQGGWTVPDVVSAQLIDAMRAQSVIYRAGARTVPLQTKKTSIARWASDPAVAWRAELGTIPESDPTLEKIEFIAKSCAVIVRASREVLEDSVNIDAGLQRAFTQAFAGGLDRVALIGNGVDEPCGIYNYDGIHVVSADGADFTYGLILDAIQKMEEANAPFPTAAVLSPRTDRTIAAFVGQDLQPLRRPVKIENLPFLVTSKIPNNLPLNGENNASTVILGNFPEMMIGIRTQLQVAVLKEHYATTGEYGFLGWMRADVQLEHEKSFAKLDGICRVVPAS